jgi:DNA-binding MarR family transcriptional regulator
MLAFFSSISSTTGFSLDKKVFDRNIGFLVSDIARLIGVEYNRIMKPMGLTTPQFRMIMQLQRQDGVTQSSLANILAVGKVSTSGLIDRLEQSGWIERRADPNDRRSNLIYLTDKGHKIESRMLDTGKALTKQTLKNLDTKQRSTLIDLLVTVKANLLEVETTHMDD